MQNPSNMKNNEVGKCPMASQGSLGMMIARAASQRSPECQDATGAHQDMSRFPRPPENPNRPLPPGGVISFRRPLF